MYSIICDMYLWYPKYMIKYFSSSSSFIYLFLFEILRNLRIDFQSKNCTG